MDVHAEPTVEAEAAGVEAAIEDAVPESRSMVEQDLLVEDVSIDGMCGVY